MTGKSTVNKGTKSGRRRRGGRSRREAAPLQLKLPPPPTPAVLERLRATLDQGRYVVFDIETTGGNPDHNGITEIFAVRFHGGEVRETFYSLVNPGIPIPPIVRRMTGINNKMLKGEPRIKDVMPGFVEFVGDDILVSHNTIGDMKFLRYFTEKVCGRTLDNFYLCTHLLVEKLAPEAPDKSLKGLAGFFKLPADDKLHRAEADAYVTLELFKVLIEKMWRRSVRDVMDAVRLQGDLESAMRLGWGVDPAKLDLPPKPGVFVLTDHEAKVTFLSSALNLQRDVGKLSQYEQLPRQLLRLVLRSADLEAKPRPNTFAALMAECDELERHRVTFHPANWHQRTAQALYLAEEDGSVRISVGNLVEGTIGAYGPIRDRKVAYQVVERIGEVFQVKPTRKGVLIPKENVRWVQLFLAGGGEDELRAAQKSRFALKLLFRPKERRAATERARILKGLAAIKRPEFVSLLDVTGVVLVSNGRGGSEAYKIVRGRPHAPFELREPPEAALADSEARSKLAEELEREQAAMLPTPLTAVEADRVGATLWWILGRKGQGRFVDLKELRG